MTLEEENAALKVRIAELSAMLNNSAKDAAFMVENERDACERTIRFFAKSFSEAGGDLVIVDGLYKAAEAIHSRKNPDVRWVAELAYGTVLGEFVEQQIERALKAKAKNPG